MPPPFDKYLGHLGRGPLWILAIVILNLNYLLQVEHLMYRLKYPFGLAIYNYHLLLFIVIVDLCYISPISSRCEMEEIYSAYKVEQINDYLFIDTYKTNNK